MAEYRLNALLKLREHKKQAALQELNHAIATQVTGQKKLSHIETRLRDAIVERTKRQNNFFQKAFVVPSTKTDIVCHVASHQKAMINEIRLRKMLADQEEQVRSASHHVEVAQHAAVQAERNLKVIEKHYFAWLHALHRKREIKEEYAVDDQNGVRFLLRKA